MMRTFKLSFWVLMGTCWLAPTIAAVPTARAENALERYVKQADPTYSWRIVRRQKQDGWTALTVDMVSQKWLTREQVDRTEWRHWLTLAIPDQVRSDIGFLYISGGRNGGEPPKHPSELVQQLALATQTVVAELRMVPNQPLIFHGDGQPRVEDDLIGYCWDQYLESGDAMWLPRNAMVKSAVRAMDTMTRVAATEDAGGHQVERFVVAGGSKRGWTTWLTGAVDDRVVGIVPLVIDVLNVDDSMRHHFAAYGFWAPSVGDYVQHGIMERMNHPRLESLYELVDPYSYRKRLTMPKFIVNASGDQFFLPDSSQFYWKDLEGPKYLRYVPNADHSLRGSDALQSVTAFYAQIVSGRPMPRYTWEEEATGAIRVRTETAPRDVRLWQATNPDARDFRIETLGPRYASTVLTRQDDGSYLGRVAPPKRGWTAYFVELTYDVGGPLPVKFTTGVRVTPDVLPYAGRDPHQTPSLTIVYTAPDADQARRLAAEAVQLIEEKKLAQGPVLAQQAGRTAYLNFRPSNRFSDSGRAVAGWLRDKGGEQLRYQLESGRTITVE